MNLSDFKPYKCYAVYDASGNYWGFHSPNIDNIKSYAEGSGAILVEIKLIPTAIIWPKEEECKCDPCKTVDKMGDPEPKEEEKNMNIGNFCSIHKKSMIWIKSGFSEDRWVCDECEREKSDRYNKSIFESYKKKQEPETFDWLTAMKMFSKGVDIQGLDHINNWVDWKSENESMCFNKKMTYRRKPLPKENRRYWAVIDDNSNFCRLFLDRQEALRFSAVDLPYRVIELQEIEGEE